MKLLSVKILGDNFRSLQADELYEFNYSKRADRLSTKIFAGLNGSGKSNFLELFSEIFYYLELYHLDTVPAAEKAGKDFGFEIAYTLPFQYPVESDVDAIEHTEEEMHIRVRKELNGLPEFAWKKKDAVDFKRADTNTQLLLPTKIIAYTSGQNELLSNSFFKIKYHYFKEMERNGSEKKDDIIGYDRIFFLDYAANFSVFTANLLLADKNKIEYLKRIFKIQDLESFRITINLVNYKKNPIVPDNSLEEHISKLKLCATSWIEKTPNKERILLLDYKVTQATKDAFAFHFVSAFKLFKVFYALEILNLHLVPVDTRNLILKAHKSLNLSDEMPRPDPSRLAFRIEKIKVNKLIDENTNKIKDIYYKGLSDGEHQFNEVIGSVLMMEDEGCLFLLDEPDTHFNPLWRAKLIKLLNFAAADSFDAAGMPASVRQQEIILTTHSPFVISDSQTRDVYKFSKTDGVITYANPKIETYGASIGLLVEVIFDRDISISDLSNADLEALKKSIQSLEDVENAKEKLLDFGESIEKFDVYSFLRKKEEEFKISK